MGEFGVCADDFGSGAAEAAFGFWERGGGLYTLEHDGVDDAVKWNYVRRITHM